MRIARPLFLFLWVPVSIFGISTAVMAQTTSATDPDVAALEQRVDLFFRSLVRNLKDPSRNAKLAFDELLVGGRLALPKSAPKVRALAEQTKLFNENYGVYVGHEHLSSKRVGASLVFLRYLYKAKDFPIVWYFTYYRSSQTDNWVIVGLKFDTQLNRLENGTNDSAKRP